MECVKFLFDMHFDWQSSKLSRSNRCYHSDCTCQISVEEAMRGRMGDGQTMVENLALSLCRQLLRWLPTFSNMPNLNCVEFSYWTCWWLSNMQTECWFGVFHVQPTLVFHRFPRRFPPARSQDGPVTRGGLVGFEALGRWLCGYGAAWVRNAGMKMIKGRWKLHFNGVK